MRIISIQKGFACDHSSTSYEFLAVDKPLDKKARRDVSSLSSRASPTERHVSFIYHADGYDVPGGWEKLMQQHYDVMYSESYDWWTLAMAFDAPKKQQEVIRLKFQQQMINREIARCTELSESNVGYLLHTGLKTLREQMINL